jgi:hypothetical protein
MKPFITLIQAALLAALSAGGCGGDAGVELAAAQTVESLAESLALAVGEYHQEVQTGDDQRESAVVAALITRVKQDAADEATTAAHAAAFTEAMARIRQDRGVEWERYRAALDNVGALGEVAAGLRRLAIESMSLQDEARRYLLELSQRRKPVSEPTAEAGG